MDVTFQSHTRVIGRSQVLTAGVCSLVLTMGMARFVYTPLLPLMQAQAGLSDLWAGWLATLNYLGYLLGALLVIVTKSARVKDSLYRAGLLIGVFSTFGMGLTQNTVCWAVLRIAAGFSSAAGMFLASAAVLAWLRRSGYRQQLGIHFIGLALGIAVSGVLALVLAHSFSWNQQWFAAGALASLLMIPAWIWMPSNGGVTPVQKREAKSATKKHLGVWLSASYFCAGVGYVIGATFIVVIVNRRASFASAGDMIWIVTGCAAIPACALWDRLSRTIGEVGALLAAYALQIVATLLLFLSGQPIFAFTAAALFGATFIGIVALTLAMAGRNAPENPARAMAALTLSYGVAQIIAPAVAGNIAAKTGSYDNALYLAAAVMGAGMALLLPLLSVRAEQKVA